MSNVAGIHLQEFPYGYIYSRVEMPVHTFLTLQNSSKFFQVIEQCYIPSTSE